MARILKNLLLLTLVVALILPVGWCCRPAKASTTSIGRNAGAEKACCHAREAQTQRPAKSHCPLPPVSKCCCSVDSVASEKAVLTVEIDSLPALPLSMPAVDLPRNELQVVDRGAFQTGPPLNVLLCVWVC